MTFLFNSDARRGAIFAEAFAKDLPDVPFSMDASSVDGDTVRYLITLTVPRDLDATGTSKSSSRSARASIS